jgi:hypothetical protein
MPRMQWPLAHGRPCVQIFLTLAQGRHPLPRTLLADTGAGSLISAFEFILDEDDCLLCGGIPLPSVMLGGAYVGSFPIYDLPVRLPALGLDQRLHAVGVPSVPVGFDGIACFGFLNGFSYGNFGDPNQFGLEC